MNIRNRFEDIENGGIMHTGFKIGIMMKGIDGVLEIIGGILLIFINPVRLNRIIAFLTQHELYEDPRDIIANFIVHIGSKFSVSTQNFGEFYLMTHGLFKLLLVTLLIRKKLWAYPLAVIFLVLFIFYQLYRFTFSHSFGLILLSIFDAIIIILTMNEYKRMKS